MTKSQLLSTVAAIGRKTGKGNTLITWNEFRAIMATEYVKKDRTVDLKTFVSESFSYLKQTGFATAFKPDKEGADILVIFYQGEGVRPDYAGCQFTEEA